MRSLRLIPSLAAACGLTIVAVGAAVAQDAPPPAHPPMQGAGEPMARMREHMQHRRDEHARLLHDALAIRPDQEAAFQALQASMAPPAGAWERRREGGEGARGTQPLTTPERLDRMAARMAAHQAAFQRHAAAVKAFYAVLSPQQQHTFDALAKLGRHHGMGGPGMRGPDGGMGGEGGPAAS